jgi:choline dehydrogenase-like flavoprotein
MSMSRSSSLFCSRFLKKLHYLHSENRATGVAFALNPLIYPDGPNKTRTVRGTKLVVVSAGTFGSPGILERSGIGGTDILEGVGVKQRVDLPGVGENYQGRIGSTSPIGSRLRH